MLKTIALRHTFSSVKDQAVPWLALYQSFFISVVLFLLYQLYDHIQSSYPSNTDPLTESCLQHYSFNLTLPDENHLLLKTATTYLTREHFIQGLANQESIVSFVQDNPGIQSLMATAGLSKNLTFNAIKDAAYRFYESKGRAVADAYDVLLKNGTSLSKTLELFKNGFRVEPKSLRNILPTGFYSKPLPEALPEALKDYLGFILAFQSILRQDLHSAPQDVYRFGPLYDVLNGSFPPSPSLRFVSGAESQALFSPSYFRRCIVNQTLHLYLIKGVGAPIYETTDNNLRRLSEIGTREIVFPLGTSFSFLNQSKSPILDVHVVQEITDPVNPTIYSSLICVELDNHIKLHFLLKLPPLSDPVSVLQDTFNQFNIRHIQLVTVEAK